MLLGRAALLLAVFFSFAFAGTGPEDQYTFLAGDLPDTLYSASSPFMVLADIFSSGTYIEPGVTIYFTSGTKLRLENTNGIVIDGLEASPVRLLGAGGAAWGGIDVCITTGWGQYGLIDIGWTEIIDASHGILINTGASSSQYIEVVLRNLQIVGSGQSGISISDNGELAGIEISDCRFSGCDVGIQNGWYCSQCTLFVNGGEVVNNRLGIRTSGNFLKVQGVRVEGNQTGIRVDGGQAAVNDCVLWGNQEHDVYVTTSVTSMPSQDFRFNDWGEATTLEMEAGGLFADISGIYDWWDNHSYSLVDYSGYSGGTTGVRNRRASWGEVKSLFR